MTLFGKEKFGEKTLRKIVAQAKDEQSDAERKIQQMKEEGEQIQQKIQILKETYDEAKKNLDLQLYVLDLKNIVGRYAEFD